ncbi:hypothetical protein [Streptomyces nojiriensis]|uniref:hypothetical protein n=1 Tax=Streptomyces nojiriensis TaxID=66374 RepID=UPI0036638A10
MAKRVIDVTLASISNTGNKRISPYGFISAQTVRAVDDEQVFQDKDLYQVEMGKPIHGSGALYLDPGQSLTYNITQQLSVTYFDDEGSSPGQYNQMLQIHSSLQQRIYADFALHERLYTPSRHKVHFDELEGFATIPRSYSAFYADVLCGFTANYTVNVVSSSG